MPYTQFVLFTVLLIVLSQPSFGANDVLTKDHVMQRVNRQYDQLGSLHLRVRRTTSIGESARSSKSWPLEVFSLEHAGIDDVLEAFKGKKRYRRVFELDYSPSPFGQPADVDDHSRHYLDRAKAWTGVRLLERNAIHGSRRVFGANYGPKFEYLTTAADEAQEEFSLSLYRCNIGLALPDPTSRLAPGPNFRDLFNLRTLLHSRPYEIVRQSELVDGQSCVVLEGKYECVSPLKGQGKRIKIVDRLWLDRDFGFVLRKRITLIDQTLMQVLNQDFVEVHPGFWLPKASKLNYWEQIASPQLPDRRSEPAIAVNISLVYWIVNEVPDELFDVALTSPDSDPLFQQTQAVHWRSKGKSVLIEGWAVKNVGTRIEYRNESGVLTTLVVQSPRWRFAWRPEQNRVLVQPSTLHRTDGYSLISPNVNSRHAIIRESEVITAMFSERRVVLEEREAVRLFVHLPADPLLKFAANLHHADPVVIRDAPIPTKFFTRRHWFDPSTGLIVGRQCGCRGTPDLDSKYTPRILIDYPDREQLSEELFKFKIPRTADVTLIDPELGRSIRSDGKAKKTPQPTRH